MRQLTAVSVAALVLAGTSAAAWSESASGVGAAAARSMPTGSTPTATAPLLSTTVTVTWTASSFSGGPTVDGYVVKRYDATLGGAGVAATGGCSGVVHAATCAEASVGVGQWKYTVTPAQGAWRGTEGPLSSAVTVPGL